MVGGHREWFVEDVNRFNVGSVLFCRRFENRFKSGWISRSLQVSSLTRYVLSLLLLSSLELRVLSFVAFALNILVARLLFLLANISYNSTVYQMPTVARYPSSSSNILHNISPNSIYN